MASVATENFDWTPRRRRLSSVLACLWLAYLVPVVVAVMRDRPPIPLMVLTAAALGVFVVCYVRLITVGMRAPFQLAAPWSLVTLLAVTGLLMWPIGASWRYAAPYFLAALLPGHLPHRWWVPVEVAVLASAFGAGLAYGDSTGGLAGYVLSVVALALCVCTFYWLLTVLVRLRVARAELARLAVADERLRIARDLHDVLGHRLAGVALKSDLAGRLVTADPARSAIEMADAARIARESLEEVRATVSGFRDTSLTGELATARALLAAAGVECVLATPEADGLTDPVSEAAGWVVREGVTNVVRHARASRAWITVRAVADWLLVEVADDGCGAAGPGGHGNGLTGLTERVSALGGSLQTGAGTGTARYRLRVELPLVAAGARLAAAG